MLFARSVGQKGACRPYVLDDGDEAVVVALAAVALARVAAVADVAGSCWPYVAGLYGKHLAADDVAVAAVGVYVFIRPRQSSLNSSHQSSLMSRNLMYR